MHIRGANTTQTLIRSLENEVGTLQRESEASKLRRSTAIRESKAEVKPKDRYGSHVIASQAIKSTSAHLVNFEDLEDLNKVLLVVNINQPIEQRTTQRDRRRNRQG